MSSVSSILDSDWGVVIVVVGYFGSVVILIYLGRLCSGLLRRPCCRIRRSRHDDHLLLQKHGFIDIMDLQQAILSAVSCMTYVLQTYSYVHDWVNYVELVMNIMFALDYSLQFYLSRNRLIYIFTPYAIIDTLTVVPMLFAEILGIDESGDHGASVLFRCIRLSKLFRILRAFRVLRAAPGDGIKRELFLLAFTVLAIVFTAAGFYQVFEDGLDFEARGPASRARTPYHEALYYASIEVLGRPRIVPEQGNPEVFALLTVVVFSSVIFIPPKVANLVKIWQATPFIMRRTFQPRWSAGQEVPHIVVLGHIEFPVMNLLLYEIFHSDRGSLQVCDVVIMSAAVPDRDMDLLTAHPAYTGHVQYLQGSPHAEADLRRACVQKASAVLLLSNKFPADPQWEDMQASAIILTCKALKNAWLHQVPGDVPKYHRRLRIIAQVLLPETRKRIVEMPGWDKSRDSCLVIQELLAAMVALAAVHRGLATLLLNLLSHTSTDGALDTEQWFRQYQQGSMHDLYKCSVPPNSTLCGCTLREAAEILLSHKQMLLIGVQRTTREGGRKDRSLELFPGSERRIEAGDITFVIANCQKDVARIVKRPTDAGDAMRCVSSIDPIAPTLQRDDSGNVSLVWENERSAAVSAEFLEFGARAASSAAKATTASVTALTRHMSSFAGGVVEEARRVTGTTEFTDAPAIGERVQALSESGVTGVYVGGDYGLIDHREGNKLYVLWDRSSAHCAVDIDTWMTVMRRMARTPAVREHSLEAGGGRQQQLAALLQSAYGGSIAELQADLREFRAGRSAEGTAEVETLSKRRMRRGNRGVAPPGFAHSRRRGERVLTAKDLSAMEMDEVPSWLVDHVLICGGEEHLLILVVRVLLQRDPELKIVLLGRGESELVKVVREEPGWHDKVHVIKGSSGKADDLRAVHSHQARTIVVLPVVRSSSQMTNSAEDRRIIDADTILMTNILATRPKKKNTDAFEHVWTVTQLVQEASLNRFFGMSAQAHGGTSRFDQRWLAPTPPMNISPLFAAGHVTSSATLDRFLVESYFNPHAMYVVESLFGLPRLFSGAAPDAEPKDAGGDAGLAAAAPIPDGPCAFQIPIPHDFYGKTYGELCHFLMNRPEPLLPLGLFRYPQGEDTSYSLLVSKEAVQELDFRQPMLRHQGSLHSSCSSEGRGAGRAVPTADVTDSSSSSGSEYTAGSSKQSATHPVASASSGQKVCNHFRLPFVESNPPASTELELKPSGADLVFVLGRRINVDTRADPPKIPSPKIPSRTPSKSSPHPERTKLQEDEASLQEVPVPLQAEELPLISV